jgi:hypothetical protein
MVSNDVAIFFEREEGKKGITHRKYFAGCSLHSTNRKTQTNQLEMASIDVVPPDDPPPSNRRSVRFSRATSTDMKRAHSISRNEPRDMVRAHKHELNAAKVWYTTQDDSWSLFDLVKQQGSVVTLYDPATAEVADIDLNFRDVYPFDPNVVPDMTYLRTLCEPTILHNLNARSLQQKPYTYMGPILISVNPFEWYPFPDTKLYIGKSMSSDNPHPYAIAGSSSHYEKIDIDVSFC